MLILGGVGPSAVAADAYQSAPGPIAVSTADVEWHDSTRSRDVPARIYHPTNATGPVPVILFSHGLGGTRDSYEYLGRHWASHGYVCVHLQHIGSDDSVWRDVPPAKRMKAMRKAASNLRNAIHRPQDVSFALDELTRMNTGDPTWRGKFDLERVGIAGHSFGAYTVLASTGLHAGKRLALSDPRIKAGIAMSSPVNRTRGDLDQNYAGIRVPLFHMTGTEDTSVVNDTTAEQRRIPYDHIVGADQYLLILTGGDHMVFSGVKRSGEKGAQDAVFHDLIRMSSTAFWDAYLKGDASARTWLANGHFESVLGAGGTFERKQTAGGG